MGNGELALIDKIGLLCTGRHIGSRRCREGAVKFSRCYQYCPMRFQYIWWSTIKKYRLMERDWEELDISGTGKLYCFIPRRAFVSLASLNIASTELTNRHFKQLMESAISLQQLDISYCPALDQIAIFQAKETLHELVHIAISGNRQFTILVIACLCSCPELVTIEAHGLEFSAEELLFLTKTFESIRSGNLLLETEEGCNPLDIINVFEREIFE